MFRTTDTVWLLLLLLLLFFFSTGHLFKKWVDLSRENCRKDELSQGSSNGIRGYIRKSYVALIEEREGVNERTVGLKFASLMCTVINSGREKKEPRTFFSPTSSTFPYYCIDPFSHWYLVSNSSIKCMLYSLFARSNTSSQNGALGHWREIWTFLAKSRGPNCEKRMKPGIVLDYISDN